MSEITSIDVPGVYAIGDAVLAVAGGLERLSAGTDQLAHLADDAVEGSLTCAYALPLVSLSWSATLRRMAGEVRAHGTALQQAATDYRRADAEAYERVKASGHPAFRPGGAGF